jgi:Domain of unknown function (DUF4369)
VYISILNLRYSYMLSRSFLKTNIKTVCLWAACWPSAFVLAQGGYEIKVTFKPYTKGYVYLAHYFGKSIYVKDSVPLGAGGQAVFAGPKPLQGGIYMLVNPGKSQLVEMLIDKNQHFSIVADSADLVHGTRFTGSQENDIFTSYQAYAAAQFQKIRPLQTMLGSAHTHADSAKISAQIQEINKETIAYRESLMSKYPDSFLTVLFRLMKEPEIPAAPTLPNGRKDSLFAYRYYKAHYWDGNFFRQQATLYTHVRA